MWMEKKWKQMPQKWVDTLNQEEGWGCSSAVQRLPGKQEVVSSISWYQTKQNNKQTTQNGSGELWETERDEEERTWYKNMF